MMLQFLCLLMDRQYFLQNYKHSQSLNRFKKETINIFDKIIPKDLEIKNNAKTIVKFYL